MIPDDLEQNQRSIHPLLNNPVLFACNAPLLTATRRQAFDREVYSHAGDHLFFAVGEPPNGGMLVWS
jgi:hypothetical protein